MARLIDILPKVRGKYREHADLSKTNWFGVGGPAEILYKPEDTDDLSYFLKNKPPTVPVTVIGVGSNLLIRDGGIDGVVIRLGRGFASITHQEEEVHAGAGALDYNVALYSLEHSLTYLEFLSGIPGGIGGALAMNAGAYGSDIASVLISAEILDMQGNIHILGPREIGYVYRGNSLPEGWIFTKAILRAKAGEYSKIEAKIKEISEKREASQPVHSRTSGSTFANPEEHKAWELIDQAGCRGLKVGDAIMSPMHCNFMINLGGATAKDLETLGETVRQRVKDCTGVELKWEVKRIGKFA
jgi:UDP-N-acetylmuramate dehydrogenase